MTNKNHSDLSPTHLNGFIMNEFLQESLKPQVFWSALASIGALLAVLTAIFLPIYNKRKRLKRVERLITGEIFRNYTLLKTMRSGHPITLPDGSTQKVVIDEDQVARLLVIELWKEYKYKLADERPTSFKKYQEIIGHLESILKNSNNIEIKLRKLMIKTELDSFTEKCEYNLGYK